MNRGKQYWFQRALDRVERILSIPRQRRSVFPNLVPWPKERKFQLGADTGGSQVCWAKGDALGPLLRHGYARAMQAEWEGDQRSGGCRRLLLGPRGVRNPGPHTEPPSNEHKLLPGLLLLPATM